MALYLRRDDVQLLVGLWDREKIDGFQTPRTFCSYWYQLDGKMLLFNEISHKKIFWYWITFKFEYVFGQNINQLYNLEM